jgi:hypothetical protein
LAYTTATATVTILPRLFPEILLEITKHVWIRSSFLHLHSKFYVLPPNGIAFRRATLPNMLETGMYVSMAWIMIQICWNQGIVETTAKHTTRFFNSPEVVRCFLHQIFFPDMRKNEMVKSTARATSDFHKFPPFIVVKCVFPNKLPRHIAQKRKYVDGCLVKAVRSGCLWNHVTNSGGTRYSP